MNACNKYENPLDYTLQCLLDSKIVDKFTVYNAKDEVLRLRKELEKIKICLKESNNYDKHLA